MRYPIYLRIIAFLTGGTPVWLKDYNSKIRPTIAKADPWGKLTAPVYPITGVGRVTLLDGGEVLQPHYCKEWKEA